MDSDGAFSIAQPFRHVGRPVTVRFPTADAVREVQHGVPEIPHGYVVLASTGIITRAPGVQWTKELASIRSSVAHDEAILAFVVLKEEPLDVNP